MSVAQWLEHRVVAPKTAVRLRSDTPLLMHSYNEIEKLRLRITLSMQAEIERRRDRLDTKFRRTGISAKEFREFMHTLERWSISSSSLR